MHSYVSYMMKKQFEMIIIVPHFIFLFFNFQLPFSPFFALILYYIYMGTHIFLSCSSFPSFLLTGSTPLVLIMKQSSSSSCHPCRRQQAAPRRILVIFLVFLGCHSAFSLLDHPHQQFCNCTSFISMNY